MSVKEAVLAAIKELILPELQVIRHEQAEFKVALELTNKRLGDMNTHLVDQSRRIDEINKRIDDTNKRIDEINKRIDDTNKRVDVVHSDLISRIDALQAELSGRINAFQAELSGRIDETNKRLDRLYEVIVRREEHQSLTMRVAQLEQEVAAIKQRQAA